MTHDGAMLGRIVTAGLDTWAVSLRIAETMAASQAVIGARMAMFGAGVAYPARLPVAELNRLVPEKTAAFGKATAGAARSLRRRGATDSMLPLDWWETSIRIAAAWWAPIHAQATANARRLA